MSPCLSKVNEFELWFHTASDATQREVLNQLRKRAQDLGVTVVYHHLAAVEDAFAAENPLDLLTGLQPQITLN